MANPVELWKAQKHGFDVWPDIEKYAAAKTPMADIAPPDLERMKWYGVYYRKRDGDGTYMLRIRLTGCELNSEQAKAIAYIAYEFGYGIVDVTTRANIQVQGLKIEHVPAALERLYAVGLTAKQTGHDNIRNVFGHPFSGVDPDELIDTRPLCREITEVFLDSRIYSDLPRKFNIAVNGREEHGAHYWSQDISLLACRVQGDVLFQVLIGGTQGQNPQLAWHLPVLTKPEQVAEITRALLDLFREKGSRERRDAARFRFLIDRIGVSGVLEWLEERLPFSLQPNVVPPAPPTGYDDLVGWFRQKEPKLWTLGLCVPLGRLSWQQLEGIALAARKWGDGSLRVTHEQGLAILNIPTGFKDAAATACAAHGVSPYADTLDRNTVACTGKQFCNIAVTETKGHMLRLIDQLRERALTLHGIRIHMSGCPSSCAQHFTADIGLKGVRVRRLLGTREGFDVYLGGGVSGQVHLGLLYKLGVDVDQLPQLIEDVVKEYYLRHKPGMTFSAYWREKLRNSEAARVGDAEYAPPVWLCEPCGYKHKGEDPPVYCPKCAGLRRHFARLDEETPSEFLIDSKPSATARTDGFAFAVRDEQLAAGTGLAVEIAGREYALFRDGATIHAIDNACPHEGAPLAQGEFSNGVVTCPWHGWTFNACTGCSISPAGRDLKHYETKIEDGAIYIKTGVAPTGAMPALPDVAAKNTVRRSMHDQTAVLRVMEIIQETPDVKTLRLDNSAGQIPAHRPGQFLRICAPLSGRDVWRSFTISSPPTQTSFLDLTIKRNPLGEVSNWLHDSLALGSELKVRGPQGSFLFDPEKHREPLVLISAGSGITPMMCIARFLANSHGDPACTFLHGARGAADIIFADQCAALAAASPAFRYVVSLTQPSDGWNGLIGRLTFDRVAELVPDIAGSRYFLCGPGEFMEALEAGLRGVGVPQERIHTEQFQSAPRVAATTI